MLSDSFDVSVKESTNLCGDIDDAYLFERFYKKNEDEAVKSN